MRKIILAANPSHSTTAEKEFWHQLDSTATSRGWRLVKHVMRRIPTGPATMIMPARLHDVAAFLSDLPLSMAFSLPEWMDQECFNLLLEWEYKRWDLRAHNKLTEVGLKKLAWHVDGLFKSLKPAITIVTNKIDHGCMLFDLAGRFYGSDVVFFERSAADTFFTEPRGMFGESMIWDAYEDRDRNEDEFWFQSGQDVVQRIRDNPNGFRPQQFKTAAAEKAFERAKKPVFFLPMDNVLWTGWAQDKHPQKTVDYGPNFPSPSEAINRIAQIVGELGGTLIVKTHPADIEPYSLDHDNIVMVDTPLGLAMEECDVCISFLTKVAFVSIASDIPTVVIGRNPVAASGSAFYAETVEDWAPMIENALKATKKDLALRAKQFQLFMGWLENEVFITSGTTINFTKPNTIGMTEDRITKSHSSVFGSAQIVDRIIDDTVKNFNDRQSWIINTDYKNPVGEISVLFDVSRLAKSQPDYDGVSRYTRQMFNALGSIDGVTLYPILAHPSRKDLGHSKSLLSELSQDLDQAVYGLDSVADLGLTGPIIQYSPHDPLVDIPDVVPTARFVTVHDIPRHTDMSPDSSNAAAEHVKTVLDTLGIKDHILTTSDLTRTSLMRHVGLPSEQVTKITLCSHAVSPPPSAAVETFFTKHNLRDQGYFLLFAPATPSDEFQSTVDAIRNFVTSNPETDMRFIVINRAKNTKVKRILTGAKLPKETLSVLTSISDADLTVAYSGARALVHPNMDDQLGFPIKDAIGANCAIITSSFGALAEIVGKSAFYVDPSKPDSLEIAITALSLSGSLVEELSAAALKGAAGKTWNNCAKTLRDSFVEAAKNVELSLQGLGDLYSNPERPNVMNTIDDWRTIGGNLVATPRHANVGGAIQTCLNFVEDKSDGVHASYRDTLYDGRRFISSVVIRSCKRENAVLWITQRVHAKDMAKAEVYVDLRANTVLKTRVALGNVLIEDASITDIGSGWKRVELHTVWKERPDQVVRLAIGPMSESIKTIRFQAAGLSALELLDSKLSTPDSEDT